MVPKFTRTLLADVKGASKIKEVNLHFDSVIACQSLLMIVLLSVLGRKGVKLGYEFRLWTIS